MADQKAAVQAGSQLLQTDFNTAAGKVRLSPAAHAEDVVHEMATLQGNHRVASPFSRNASKHVYAMGRKGEDVLCSLKLTEDEGKNYENATMSQLGNFLYDVFWSGNITTKGGYYHAQTVNVPGSVVLLTETWLDVGVADSELFDTNAYTVFRKDSTVLVGCVYYPPSIREESYRLLEVSLRAASLRNYENILVFGDFNSHIDWFTHEEPVPRDRSDDFLLDIASSAGLTQACAGSTYSARDGTSSFLDLLFVVDPTRIVSCETSEGLPDSDHLAIEVTYAAVLPRRGHHARTLWKFDQTDHGHLARLAHLAPWCMTTTANEPLGHFDLWCDLAGAIQKEYVPFRTRSSGRNYCPWITPDIMKAARIKRGLFRKASRSNCPVALHAAKDHQRALKAAIHVAHQRYTSTIAQKAKDDLKVFWSYVRRLRRPCQRPSFCANGRMIDAPGEIAALFADHFSSVYNTDGQRLSAHSAAFAPSSSGTDASSLEEITFSTEALSIAVSKIKHSQCPGPDGVAPAFFKMIMQHTLPSLARVLQSLFDVGAVPASWQHALVTPIHKGKGKPTDDVTHYRPVSITLIICRTFERVVNGQLLDFLEGTGYLSQSQHGCRHNRNCETALATLSHFVSNCIDNRTETDLV
ncbi:uncharacterized protein LOC120842566 [Ixodes scapularis]|uniref:uncharacterized protein LOC120842566 n=1 Tax=Ixodes scapularis TaxID=6945 RepID=UPI001A9CD11B|nr:uncharacterized protein LOC120842566 [Ixodes scapularis]